MNGTAAKATRREIRRAFGPQAVNAISETQQNTQATVRSVAFAHERIDAMQHKINAHDLRIDGVVCAAGNTWRHFEDLLPSKNTFWGRLKWLVTGR